MPRKYKRKGKIQQWKKEDLCQAIQQLKTKRITLGQAVRLYGIPKTTLHRRMQMCLTTENMSQNISLGRFRPTFSPEQEQLLKDYVIQMDSRLFGLRPIELRGVAFQFAEANNIPRRFNKETGLAGDDWYQSFMLRNPELKLRVPEKTSFARACGFNKNSVNKFFDLLTKLMDRNNFQPSRIYNVDETGITTVPNCTPKVLSVQGKKQVGTLASAERGETVTCVICCNAAGNFIPPLLIFPRKRENPALVNGCPPETLPVYHPSGWMQTDIFCPTWFNHFKKYVKPSKEDPVLLILDGHVTYVKNIALIEAAREAHTHILCIPPHTSHKIQPLDRTFMNPLKTYYSQECLTWLRSHPGQVITLRSIGELFGKAYSRAAVPQNAISGFQSSGICPLYRFIFGEEEFAPALTTNIDRTCDEPSKIQEPTENQQEVNNINDMETLELQDIPVISSGSVINMDDINILYEEPSDNGASTSKSTASSVIMKEELRVKPHDILPLPKVKYTTRADSHSKRKGKTVIVTSSPYAKEMKENEKKKPNIKSLKQTDRVRKNLVFSKEESSTQDKSPTKEKSSTKAQKRKVTKADVTPCLVCKKLFSKSSAGMKWIQCQECQKWAHEKCVVSLIRSSSFLCEDCTKAVILSHLTSKSK